MDSRFELKAEFSVYGKTFKWDTNLNWTAEPGEVDRRIVEWFQECYEEAEMENSIRLAARDGNLAEAKKIEQEITELKRLKEKYPEI